MAMRKKICIALIAVFTVLLGVSGYFIFDHYREAKQQAQMYDSLVQIVEDSKTCLLYTSNVIPADYDSVWEIF